jgi:uncharacterized protein YbjT (DUF2867 family)
MSASDALVTGATGQLGPALVAALRERGYGVRAMSRRPGTDRVVADLSTGGGLAEAVDGCRVVVHAATDSHDTEAVDVEGTERLADVCKAAGVEHLVYVSIVGIDRNPIGYYRAKLTAEQRVARSGVPYSIVRASQFHSLVATMLDKARRGPVCVVPAGWEIEPVATVDVARHLADRAAAGPSGSVSEFAGPERLGLRDVARVWLAAGGGRAAVLPVPIPGKAARAFRMRSNIASPDAARGQVTWADWLSQNAGLSSR